MITKEYFIAMMCHAGWVGYQIGTKQEYNEIPSKEQMQSLIDGVHFFMNFPQATPEENHQNWMRKKIADGWKYGTTKDLVKKTHPDMIPFECLPEEEARKDIMDNVVRKIALSLWDTYNVQDEGEIQ
jgi:ornithine carbamoyltransferase